MTAVEGLLLAALAAAAWFDFRRRVIPNSVTYPAIAAELAAWFWMAGTEGLQFSLVGLCVCGSLMALAWLAGAVGGGDVKLGALLGGALGWINGLYAILWTFTIAAAWMLGLTIWTEGFGGTWQQLRPQAASSPSCSPGDIPTHRRPLYLAPAALAAVVLILWQARN